MVTVVDGFVDEDLRLSLLEQLPSLKEGTTRALHTLTAPSALERHMHMFRGGTVDFQKKRPRVPLCFQGGEPNVMLPARVASGSVPMHKDCFSPFDAAEHLPIEDYIGILYLDGVGSLVVDTGAGEQIVDVLPGRFVAWDNASCYHRFDAPPGGGVRAMVGPMAIDAEGCTQRAHDVWSTHPGYIAACEGRVYQTPEQIQQAEVKREHEAAIEALSKTGIPGLVDEYEEHRKKNQQLVVVTLTGKPGGGADGYIVVCTGLDGSSIAEVGVSTDQKYGSVKKTLKNAVKQVKSKRAVPRFILQDSTLLEASHEEVNIVSLLGGPAFVVTVTGSPGRGVDEYVVVCTGLDGSSVAEVGVSRGDKYGVVRTALENAVKQVKPKEAVPRFVLQDGTSLEASHEKVNIVRLLDCPSHAWTEADTAEKKEKREKKIKKKEKEGEEEAEAQLGEPSSSEPKVAKVTAAADGAKAGLDASAAKELDDLREENRQLKDLTLKLQSEVAAIQKERTTIGQELETVKANFKQHLTNKRTLGSGGNEAELERMLAEAREALQSKDKECETMKKDAERRLGDSKQFQDLKALLKKKTDEAKKRADEVKDLKQQLSKAGLQTKDDDDDGCIELEADSD